MKKLASVILTVIAIVGSCAVIAGLVYIFWPGPNTLVINDTHHKLEFTQCGGGLAGVAPGDVETLNPGDQVYISSGKFERANVCDVYFLDKQNETRKLPDACLPLPLKEAETVYVSQRLKSFPASDYQPCDLLMKSY